MFSIFAGCSGDGGGSSSSSDGRGQISLSLPLLWGPLLCSLAAACSAGVSAQNVAAKRVQSGHFCEFGNIFATSKRLKVCQRRRKGERACLSAPPPPLLLLLLLLAPLSQAAPLG